VNILYGSNGCLVYHNEHTVREKFTVISVKRSGVCGNHWPLNSWADYKF